RLRTEAGYLGRVAPEDCERFDFVVCSEVIEHIPLPSTDEFMHSLMDRVTPGGMLLVTTPFAEDLATGDTYCPCCDHVFHRWQHQRSWQVSDLRNLMEQWGCATTWLGLVGFADPHPIRDFHLRRRCGEAWPWQRLHDDGGRTARIGQGDHIVYIG